MTDPRIEDWITIWQSELAALAVDREWAEAGQRVVDAWAAQARAILAHAVPAPEFDHAPRPAGSDAPPRAAAAAAAPDWRELDELRARVAELERLAGR